MNNINLKHERDLLCNALMFYTRIPVPKNTPYSPELLNQSRKYFTLVGVIIGLISAVVYLLSAAVLSNSIAVLLAMIASILATGAFHEDGFADTCDGLGGGWHVEQVLTIMKDSRLGTYGAVGLFAILSLKFALLLSISEYGSMVLVLSLVAGHTVSRQHSSRLIKRFDYVQDIDKSKVKPIASAPLSARAEEFSWAVTLLPCLLFAWYSIGSVIIGLLVTYWVSEWFMRYCKKRIGGYTGDILGAIQQLTEVSFLLVCLALFN